MVILNVPFRTAAQCVDTNIFIADQPYRCISFREVHTKSSDDNVFVLLRRCQGTEAPADGDMLAGGNHLRVAAETVEPVVGVTGIGADHFGRVIETGDRVALAFSGDATGVEGVLVTVVLMPEREKRYWISEV
jgi:hypothetical protein